MTDNIIPFQTAAGRESDRAQNQKDADTRQAVSDRLRAISMRKRLDDRKMIAKVSDRIRVAKNLGLILSELKTKGHSPEKILRDLRMGSKNDSTKQLYNYVLPEGSALEQDSTKVRALTKTASKYLRIAECAAKAMGGDPDTIALRLFENTSYQVADDLPDEKVASMDQIRGLLVGLAEAAIRRNDLGAYLEILGSNRIGWDIDGTFGNYGSLPVHVYFSDRAARHVSYLGYAPTVLLYQRDAGPVAAIEGEAYQIDFAKDPDAVTNFLWENKPLPKKYRMPVSLSISREIWFGIGPMETGFTWKPIFEKRLSFHVRGHLGSDRLIHVQSYDSAIPLISEMSHKDGPHRCLWLHQFTLLPRCPDGASLSISVSPHIDTSESVGPEDVNRENLEHRWLFALDRFDSSSLAVDEDVNAAKGQFFYEAVDLGSCVKYLDQVANPDDWDGFDDECGSVSLNRQLWPGYEEREAWYQYSFDGTPEIHVASPKGSIARAIEQNLLREGSGHRLDSLLFETVTERVRAAHECYRRVLQDHGDRIAELLNSWKKV
jgi:hypothetical protein